MARKAVAGELSIDVNRAEPGLPDDVGYRHSGILRTISERWRTGQSVTPLLTLDYCVATTNGARETLSQCDGASARGTRAGPIGWLN